VDGICVPAQAALAAQSEPADDGAIAGIVRAHEVRKEPATLPDELQEAASRVIVLWKTAQMVGQGPYALRQQSDLDLRRPSVALFDSVIRDYVFLGFPRKRHPVLRRYFVYF